MDCRTSNLQALLDALFELDSLPDELWAVKTVVRALRHSDADLRELAIAVAATGDRRVWTQVLASYSVRETVLHLRRFAQLVIDEHRALLTEY